MKRECKYCGEELSKGRLEFCCKECGMAWHNAVRRGGFDEIVPVAYGSHGFDPIVASWMHRMTIPGSTLCGVNHG